MRVLFVALRTALYVTGFLFFFGWLALRVHRFARNLTWSLPESAENSGLILLILGGIIGLSCIWVFAARGRGTPVRAALFFTRTYNRILRPDLAQVLPSLPAMTGALRRCFNQLQREVDTCVMTAKLAA